MKSPDNPPPTFEELARDLECDEDEARFEEVVKRIAKATPTKEEGGPPEGESPKR